MDGDERFVEVWTPDVSLPSIERERLVWRPVGTQPAFTLWLEELFRPIWQAVLL